MSNPLVSVVVPVRAGEGVDLTMGSLMQQTLQDFEAHIIVDKDGQGAPWARNQGAACARGEYLLFSDADVQWVPDALECMVNTLAARLALEAALSKMGQPPRWRTAYAYGGKVILGAPGGDIGPLANAPWNYDELQQHNMVDTGALMLREAFTRWDEDLRRLQDWDLFLGMARYNGLRGQWVGKVLHTTPYRAHGISFNGSGLSYQEATAIVKRKHNLR